MHKLSAIVLGAAIIFAASNAAAAPAVKRPVGKVKLPLLSYTIDKSGPAAGAHPKRSDLITVNYRLTLLDGKEVDSSATRGKPDVFPLNRLIPAWQILVQQMRAGDAWTFYVPPEYAYGAVEKEGLPANSFLIFKVELVSYAPPPAEAK
jgi:FKBP-type peptidyl-prolyl cis-trans isomerase